MFEVDFEEESSSHECPLCGTEIECESIYCEECSMNMDEDDD